MRPLSCTVPCTLDLPAPCDYRTVLKDGRVVCVKIAVGDNSVGPDLCRACPSRVVDCQHFRFSLERTTPSPLVVRCNGRTEVWDDEPALVRLQQAACAARLVPIPQPDACAGCPLRQPLSTVGALASDRATPSRTGKVIPLRRENPPQRAWEGAAAG